MVYLACDKDLQLFLVKTLVVPGNLEKDFLKVISVPMKKLQQRPIIFITQANFICKLYFYRFIRDLSTQMISTQNDDQKIIDR